MTPTPESAKISHDNGKLCESLVMEKLPEFEYIGEHIDGELRFNGKPAEVKSCQKQTLRNERNGVRSGRFWFQGTQHDELIKNDGVYILLVHEGNTLISTRIVKASKLFPVFEGAKTAAWTTINRVIDQVISYKGGLRA